MELCCLRSLVCAALAYYSFLMQEFFIGLGIGIVAAAMIALYSSTRIGRIRKENKEEVAKLYAAYGNPSGGFVHNALAGKKNSR